LKKYLLIILILNSLVINSFAANKKLLNEFKLPKSFELEFEQNFFSQLNSRKKIQKGKLSYKHPGKIWFEVFGEEPSTFVSNKETSWYYTPAFIEGEKGEVIIRKSNNLSITYLFDLLAMSGLSKNDLYGVHFSKNKSNMVSLVFTQKGQSKLDLNKVELFFKNNRFIFKYMNKLKLSYTNNQIVSINFLNLVKEVNFAKNKFNFNIPKNTNISY
jgi:outer membrane lipoprotein-sorting protein